MGLFNKSATTNADVPKNDAPKDDAPKEKKPSFFQRYSAAKRGPGLDNLTDEEYKEQIGMTREEMAKYSATTPGVAGGQRAGSITAGGIGGLGGVDAAYGFGGWGPSAAKEPKTR